MWNELVRECFQSGSDKAEANKDTGTDEEFDVTFHSLDPKLEETDLMTLNKEKNPKKCYRKTRKTWREMEEAKLLDEIIASSSTLVPPKLDVPPDWFDGAGIDIYKFEKSKTQKEQNPAKRDDDLFALERLLQNECKISKPTKVSSSKSAHHEKNNIQPPNKNRDDPSFVVGSSSRVRHQNKNKGDHIDPEPSTPVAHYNQRGGFQNMRKKSNHFTSGSNPRSSRTNSSPSMFPNEDDSLNNPSTLRSNPEKKRVQFSLEKEQNKNSESYKHSKDNRCSSTKSSLCKKEITLPQKVQQTVTSKPHTVHHVSDGNMQQCNSSKPKRFQPARGGRRGYNSRVFSNSCTYSRGSSRKWGGNRNNEALEIPGN